MGWLLKDKVKMGKKVSDGFKVGSKAVEVNFLLVAELGLKFRGSQNKI